MRYTVKAAARATGVSRTCLRTWERRYGIPKPDRSANGRRQYDEADIATIRRMVELVDAGLPAGDAARVIRDERDNGGGPGQANAEPSAVPAEASDGPPPSPPPHPLLDELLSAACAFDEHAVVQGLRASVTALGWPEALEVVIFPLLRRVGKDWSCGCRLIAGEHFVCEIIRGQMLCAVDAAGNGHSPAVTAVLACPEGEQHDVGLLALSLLLRQRGLRVVYLGADVPSADLLALIEDIEPEAVCLSATTGMGRAALSRATHHIVSHRPLPHLFVGGPALRRKTEEEFIPGVHLPDALTAAAETIAESLADDR